MGAIITASVTGASADMYCIWISHKDGCIAFHMQENYERVLFVRETEMWRYVYQFIGQGYLVQ